MAGTLSRICASRATCESIEPVGRIRARRDRLLDAGAPAHTGFYDPSHSPQPHFESALYGAAGVAHDPALTRLLLARGVDPNDDEVPYHAPESRDLAVVEALVECGRLTADSLTMMLVRKHDWHDEPGVRYLLAHGADPNRQTRWGVTALHQAVRRDNAAAVVEALLAYGADPTRVMEPHAAHGRGDVDAVALAAWRGRADLLDLFARAGATLTRTEGAELLVACARGDESAARALLAAEPGVAAICRMLGSEWLALAAGNGNIPALRCLMAIGVPVNAVWGAGDGYFEIAKCEHRVARRRLAGAARRGAISAGAGCRGRQHRWRRIHPAATRRSSVHDVSLARSARSRIHRRAASRGGGCDSCRLADWIRRGGPPPR